ncbi:MAG: HoxN/HupN/NixA family nickel/cobalt transporter [Acidobacteriaceae bacterium]|nr:HoxN/HupN/NixA family nickel/cobalt transporter [Acidobacteriaceae bacterium]
MQVSDLIGRIRLSPSATSWRNVLSTGMKGKVLAIYLFLGVFNIAAWLAAAVAFRHFPALLGTAFLAYSLGLRHAVDADHIAAIDNVTRKLMQESKRPIGVGLLFSLGHSTVVLIGSIVIVSAASVLHTRFDAFKEVGGLIGTLVSILFLFGIALVNLFVLRTVYATFKSVRAGEPYKEEDLDLLLSGRGILPRLLRPLFRLIRSSWQMYPLGLLFGLGFDTATEIGLLGIAASEASKGLPFWDVLLFPILFTAGMSLIDTTDNILMVAAYGWAFQKPIRKLYYNLTITSVSVMIAFCIGGLEALGLLAEHFQLNGSFWKGIGSLNQNFSAIGYLIITLFVVSWVVSIVAYRIKRFDEIRVAEEVAD